MVDIIENKSLKGYNTFGMEVSAACFCEAFSVEQLAEAVLFFRNSGKDRMLVLGGGSNILFTGDYDGLVIRPLLKGIFIERCGDGYIYLRAGAGEVWDDFVRFAVSRGWGGVENLSGIPGTVGAAPVQNIGAYGAEAAYAIDSVRYLSLDDLTVKDIASGDCGFGYRESIFKHALKGRAIILSVLFRLSLEPSVNVSYADMESFFASAGCMEPTISDVRRAVLDIRERKLPDPAVLGNAGSFFRNPVVSAEQYRRISAAFPEVKGFGLPDGSFKLSAAWLIDRSGMKGFSTGKVSVHERQPLVLTASAGASGKDVLDLSEKVRSKVMERFGVVLEPEVNIV